VRSGSAADKQTYKAALGFEQMLVDQMVQSMAGDDPDSPLDAGPYAQQLQSSLSSAVEASGGLGLAQQLYHEIGDSSPGGPASLRAIAQRAIPPGEATR
jgi:Rod binding domain-containing protein